MAKVICYMRNGFAFCHPRTGLKVPATAAEIEANDWQERNLREDPRVIVLESMPEPEARPKPAEQPPEDEKTDPAKPSSKKSRAKRRR